MATGPQLRVARVARGLTLVETARRAGVGMSTLSRLENGVAALRPDVEARIKDIVQWNHAFDQLFMALATEEEPSSLVRTRIKPKKRRERGSTAQQEGQPGACVED